MWDGARARNGGLRAEDLVLQAESRIASPCVGCGAPLCGHHIIASIAAGVRDEPRCPGCLAAALGREASELAADLARYLGDRDCYRGAWAAFTRREPDCGAAALVAERGDEYDAAATREPPIDLPPFDDDWNAGDLGCGELVLELRIRLRRLTPPAVIRVIARDPGAPQDLPAWCRLTGHALVAASPPQYFIRTKET